MSRNFGGKFTDAGNDIGLLFGLPAFLPVISTLQVLGLLRLFRA